MAGLGEQSGGMRTIWAEDCIVVSRREIASMCDFILNIFLMYCLWIKRKFRL
mgnify:CR=1 FL=1